VGSDDSPSRAASAFEAMAKLVADTHGLIKDPGELTPNDLKDKVEEALRTLRHMQHLLEPGGGRFRTKEELKRIAWPESATDLHVHLGGAIPLETLRVQAASTSVRGIGPTLDHFIEQYYLDPQNIQSLEQYIGQGSYDLAEILQSGSALAPSISIALDALLSKGGKANLGNGDGEVQLYGLNRIELRFNPLRRNDNGRFDLDQLMVDAEAALTKAVIGSQGTLQAGFIICLDRRDPFEKNLILAKKVREWVQVLGLSIVGLDLAGSELANPLSDPKELAKMAKLFDIACDGIGRTAHCGETPAITIDTFLDTLQALKLQRVGHPLIAAKAWLNDSDPRGLEYMRANNIVAEICPLSNRTTKACSPAELKGILAVFDQFNVPYATCTDAPGFQDATHAEEQVILLQAGTITPEQAVRAIQTGNDASFLKYLKRKIS